MKSKLRNDESEVEYCSTKKISDLCEWKPKIDLETGIKKCINEDYKTLTKLINIG